MLPALEKHPILSGIIGTVAGGATGVTTLFHTANQVLQFVATLFGALTAVITFLLVLRKLRR